MLEHPHKYDHPEWVAFDKAFTRWLLVQNSSCWERDVLRACKDLLWECWKNMASKAESEGETP